MKALVTQKYGPPQEALAIKEIEIPKPSETQVLVKVKAASLNALDYRKYEMLSSFGKFMENNVFKSFGKIPGADISGIVHETGSKVTRFKKGDEVFGFTGNTRGAFAEYVCAKENTLTLKPSRLTFEEAAAVPVAACTALQGMRKKRQIQPGDHVLINGASGGVGSFAVQLAKIWGAKVTAVCSRKNLSYVKSLGADTVIDYSVTDFTKQSIKYDWIFAINGYHTLSEYKRCLTRHGTYMAIGGEIKQIMQAIFSGPFRSLFSRQKMGFMGISTANLKDLIYLTEFLASKKLKPPIDKVFPLTKAVDAFDYVLNKHAQGKVVIKM